MTLKNVTNAILRRHPELSELPASQIKLVKTVIQEAIALSSDVLNSEETEDFFKKRVPDSGKPSAALRAYRKRLELTQRELAKKSSIPQPHIAAMESGKRTIGLLAAKKLAIALGIDYKKLL